MSVENGRECGENAAAYVLGALTPAEAEAYRRHIADCAACREEVASFEQITAALPDAGTQQKVPRELRRRVMREVRATPKTTQVTRLQWARGRLRFPLLWAGALGVVVGSILAVSLNSGTPSQNRVVPARVAGISGSVQLYITGDRGELAAQGLPKPPAGRIYEMWVQRGEAAPTPTGTLFSPRADGSANVGVPGSLNGVSRVLVTQEAAGGTLAPTSAPVIIAPVT